MDLPYGRAFGRSPAGTPPRVERLPPKGPTRGAGPTLPHLLAEARMFHVEHDPRIAAEHYGRARESDWRVEYRPDGTFWWVVTDWTGETIAHGVRALLGEATADAVRWAT